MPREQQDEDADRSVELIDVIVQDELTKKLSHDENL